MEKKKVLLAFDLGTSGVKCAAFDTKGIALSSSYGEYQTYFPSRDLQEQKPKEWISAIRGALSEMKEDFSEWEICGIGVSGHSLGAIPVDKKGELLLCDVPIWCDGRAKAEAKAFFEKCDRALWYEKTGNGFPSHLYALFKVMWYQKHLPIIYEKATSFVGSKDYINLYLTGKIATDPSYASGSGLYDLKKGEYISEYAAIAGVDIDKFPPIVPSSKVIGRVSERAASDLGIPAGVPVVAGGVDNACMTLGAGCFEEGKSYASLGSSAWVTVCAKDPLTKLGHGIYTFAHCVEGMFIPSVGIFSSGSALDWVNKRVFSEGISSDRFEEMAKIAQKSEVGARGLYFVPCLAGGAAVDPSPNTKGCFWGLTLSHEKEDLARAAFEGIAQHLYAAAETLIEAGCISEPLLLVGGGAKGEFSRQVYADVFGMKMALSSVQQGAASLGAASLAARGCGLWDSFEPLRALFENKEEYSPCPERHKIYKGIFPNWKKIREFSARTGDETEKR